MATSGQTLNDRITAARYTLAGQGIARCVCKATTEEIIGPKKKHLDYIIACTHEQNVSIEQLANLLIERTNHLSWVVVFKALVTVHHLMCYGHDRFIQHLATINYSFELSTFLDKTATRDGGMSNYIRRYTRYINEKAISYRLLAFDLCKIKRGDGGVLRTMPIDRLLKTLPVLQQQLDALLEFDCATNDLNNGVINACFMLLFRDLINLYACYEDGIINLLEKYFKLNRKMCREAFDLYKKFVVRIDKVSEFLRIAEAVGIDKEEIPDLKRPDSLLEQLEAHLQNLESNKKILKNQAASNKSTADLISASFSKSANSTSKLRSPISSDDFSLTSIKDEEVRKALEEEAKVLSQYGTETKFKSGIVNDFSKLNTVPKTIDDIFGDADTFGNMNGKPQGQNNSSILEIENNPSKPKIDSIKSSIQFATNALEHSSTTTSTSNKKASDDLMNLLDGELFSNPLPTKNIPAPSLLDQSPPKIENHSTRNNQMAFKAGNPFPEVCSPFSNPSLINSQPIPSYNTASNIFDDFKDVLQPTSSIQKPINGGSRGNKPAGGTALFTGDLDSTLANLAQNLSLDGFTKTKK